MLDQRGKPMTRVEERLVQLIQNLLDEMDRETDGHIMNELAEKNCEHTPEYYAANTELRHFLRELARMNKKSKK
jgi:hypothetical protein